MSGYCKCHRKACRCYKTIYHSFSRPPVTFFKLLCSNSPASHNSISLRKGSSYTIRKICNLHSIRTSCNIHSIRIHLIHKTYYKCHCYIIKCCFECRRKTYLNNLRKYLSWWNALRTLLCFYKYRTHNRYNNKIYNPGNNCGNSNSHYSPVKHKQEYRIEYYIKSISNNSSY